MILKPITFYVIRLNIFLIYGLLQTGPDATQFKVTGLTPKKKYKIRVRAVNKEGESEPLETDDAILARNPYGKTASTMFTNPTEMVSGDNITPLWSLSSVFLCQTNILLLCVKVLYYFNARTIFLH